MFTPFCFHNLDTAGIFQGGLYTLHYFTDKEKWLVFQVFHDI